MHSSIHHQKGSCWIKDQKFPATARKPEYPFFPLLVSRGCASMQVKERKEKKKKGKGNRSFDGPANPQSPMPYQSTETPH